MSTMLICYYTIEIDIVVDEGETWVVNCTLPIYWYLSDKWVFLVARYLRHLQRGGQYNDSF